MRTYKNQHDRIARDLKLAEGIAKHSQKRASVTLLGETYTSEELLTLLQARTDAIRAAEIARTAWLNAVQEMHAKLEKTDPLFSCFRQQMLTTISPTSNELADYGIAPRKPRAALTSEELYEAVEKSKATRRARHTMGKRQREEIKGTVTVGNAPASDSPATATNGAPHGS
jgi:hypothetical protein